MATFEELSDLLHNNQGLRDRVVTAGWLKSQLIVDEVSPPAPRLAWAMETLERPDSRGDLLLAYVLGANSGLTKAAIIAAGEAAIQANVDAAIEKFAV